jgi:hypothetical protein
MNLQPMRRIHCLHLFEILNEVYNMNSANSLFQASKFKGNEDKMEHSMWIQFNTMQNSSKRYEGWYYDDSLHLFSRDDTCLDLTGNESYSTKCVTNK